MDGAPGHSPLARQKRIPCGNDKQQVEVWKVYIPPIAMKLRWMGHPGILAYTERMGRSSLRGCLEGLSAFKGKKMEKTVPGWAGSVEVLMRTVA